MNFNNLLIQLGENIRNIRKQKKVSQEELARKAGIDRAFVGRIERGEQNPTILTIYKIIYALNIDAKEILPKQKD